MLGSESELFQIQMSHIVIIEIDDVGDNFQGGIIRVGMSS